MQLKADGDDLSKKSDTVKSNYDTRWNSAVAKYDDENDRGPDKSVRCLIEDRHLKSASILDRSQKTLFQIS